MTVRFCDSDLSSTNFVNSASAQDALMHPFSRHLQFLHIHHSPLSVYLLSRPIIQHLVFTICSLHLQVTNDSCDLLHVYPTNKMSSDNQNQKETKTNIENHEKYKRNRKQNDIGFPSRTLEGSRNPWGSRWGLRTKGDFNKTFLTSPCNPMCPPNLEK